METVTSLNCAITGINIYKKFSFNKKVNWILKGINITIPKGKIFSLLGESGCGKTTLIKCIIGKSSIDRGVLKIMGNEPKTGPLIGYMPQSISLSDNLTVGETLWLYGKVTGMGVEKSSKRVNFLLKMLSMTEQQNTKINNLSGGEKRRVSFAVALLHEAPLIILDEPTVGVDPVLRHEIWQYLKYIVTYSNTTVLLTTHYIDEAKHSDYVSFLHDGQIRACANPTSLLEKYNSTTLEQVFLQICQSDNYSDQSQLVFDDNNIRDSPNFAESCQPYKKLHWWRSANDKLKFIESLRFKYLLTLVKMWKFELIDSPKIIICQFLLPLILLLLIPLTLNELPIKLDIAIINNDLGSLGTEFMNNMDASIYEKKIYDSYEKAVNDTRSGKLIGVIMIKENFTSGFNKQAKKDSIHDNFETRSNILVALDTFFLLNAITIPSNLLLTYQRFTKNDQVDEINGNFPLKFTTDMTKRERVKSTTYITPGLLISVCVILFSSISGITLTVTNESQLERLNITGVSSSVIAFSLALFQTILVVPFVFITVFAVFFVNGLQCTGSIFLVMLIIFMQGTCGIYLGLFISSISINGTMLIVINCAVFLLMFMLQGASFPVNILQSQTLQSISRKGPSASSIEAFRGILNYGWTLSQPIVVDAFLTSSVWILVTLIISSVVFNLRQ